MRQTAAELFEEIERLVRGIDCWRDWNIEAHKRSVGHDVPVPYNQIVSPGLMLSVLVPGGLEEWEKICEIAPELDTGRYWLEKTNPESVRLTMARHVLKEVKRWYSHTASDLQFFFESDKEDLVKETKSFLDHFKKEIGFDFFSEAGLVKKVAKKALKRGKLADEEEWYVLKEVLDDVSQTILTEEELAGITQLMNEFESSR